MDATFRFSHPSLPRWQIKRALIMFGDLVHLHAFEGSDECIAIFSSPQEACAAREACVFDEEEGFPQYSVGSPLHNPELSELRRRRVSNATNPMQFGDISVYTAPTVINSHLEDSFHAYLENMESTINALEPDILSSESLSPIRERVTIAFNEPACFTPEIASIMLDITELIKSQAEHAIVKVDDFDDWCTSMRLISRQEMTMEVDSFAHVLYELLRMLDPDKLGEVELELH